MRKTLGVIVISIFIFGCQANRQSSDCSLYIDSIIKISNRYGDTLRYVTIEAIHEANISRDSIRILKDSIVKLNTQIKYADYRSGRIVTKIQYYIDITDQRPANKNFFFGWVKRAMRQEK